MIIINNIDGAYFEFNGIRYFKNFTSVVAGNKLRILNVYDSKIELLALTDFSQITLNGTIYANVALLQAALLPVIYSIDVNVTINETDHLLLQNIGVKTHAEIDAELTALNNSVNGTSIIKEYVDASFNWIPGTYSYNVTVRSFYKNGILHNTVINSIVTSDVADGVDRIDGIVINENETITIIKGVPALAEVDADTQLLITFYTVTAGTTQPIGVSEVLWYNENLQEAGGEKNSAANNPPFVTLDSIEKASVGTKSIKIVSRNSATLTSTTKYLGSNLSNVLVDVYLLNSTSNQLRFQLWVNGTLRVGEIYVSHGTFNFNAYLINQWQTITIPGLAFRNGVDWGNYEYDFLFVGNYKSGTTVYFDNIRFQQGLNEVITTPTNYELLANKKTDIESNKTSNVFYAPIKAIYDWGVAKFQLLLVSGTNIKTINGSSILGGGDLVIGAGIALGETDTTAYRGDRGKTAYDHSQATHAPNDAQKNSDITKAEIEAKLIGEITSHTHAKLEVISYACSDETTDLTLGDKITIRMPFAMTLSEVRLSLNVAPTITKLIADVKENGVSIFSTLPSIDTTELTSVTAAIPPVISDANLADDAVLVVSVSQLGSGDIGKGLKIAFKGTRI